MPEEWRTYSTTGYVFLNSLNGIFVETQNAKLFDRIYSTFIRDMNNTMTLSAGAKAGYGSGFDKRGKYPWLPIKPHFRAGQIHEGFYP